MNDDTPWSDAKCVYVLRPACPECFHHKYIPFRSEAAGDGSTTLKALCKGCGCRFKIVRERMMPEYGNSPDDLS